MFTIVHRIPSNWKQCLSRQNVAQHQIVYFKYTAQIITTGLLRAAVAREDWSDLPFLRCSGYGWYKLSGTIHYLFTRRTDLSVRLFCPALKTMYVWSAWHGRVGTGSCVTVKICQLTEPFLWYFSQWTYWAYCKRNFSASHGYLFSSSIYSFFAKPCYNQLSTITLSTENPRPWRGWHVRKRNSGPVKTQRTRHHHSASRNVVLGLCFKNQAMGKLCTVRPGWLWRLRWETRRHNTRKRHIRCSDRL